MGREGHKTRAPQDEKKSDTRTARKGSKQREQRVQGPRSWNKFGGKKRRSVRVKMKRWGRGGAGSKGEGCGEGDSGLLDTLKSGGHWLCESAVQAGVEAGGHI